MKKRLDLGYFNDILNKHYSSKSEMAKSLGITRQHFQEVLKNKGIGAKVLSGIKKEAENKGFEYDLCLRPEPMFINGQKVESIEILNEKDELLVSITSREIIGQNDLKVIVAPEQD